MIKEKKSDRLEERGDLIISVSKDEFLNYCNRYRNMMFLMALVPLIAGSFMLSISSDDFLMPIIYLLIFFPMCFSGGLIMIYSNRRISDLEIYKNGIVVPWPGLWNPKKDIFIRFQSIKELTVHNYKEKDHIELKINDGKKYWISDKFLNNKEIKKILLKHYNLKKSRFND